MYDAWTALRPVDRTPAEGVFRQVHDLATAAGVQALVAEGLAHGVDLADELEPVDGFHAKALTAFLRWPQVFRTAWQVHHADALPGRYWRRRTGLDHVPPDLSAEAIGKFRTALSEYLRREQGRGHRVWVDIYDRGDRSFWVFAYPDDYTQTYVGHDDDGRFRRHPHRPAFEVVFHYDRAAGALDLYAPGDAHLKDWLEDVFGDHFLRGELPADRPDRPAYSLDLLRSRDCLHVLDPDPGGMIVGVRIRKVRLTIPGAGERIVPEADAVG